MIRATDAAESALLTSTKRTNQSSRDLEHRQRLEPQKVELDESSGLHFVHGVLRDVVARVVAEHGHMIPERPLADDNAGRVHSDVTRESLELLRVADDLSVLGRSKLWIRLDTLRDRSGMRLRAGRNHVRNALRVLRRHPEHSGHVFEHAPGLQLHEGRDLAHALRAVLLAHVRHHLVAACHAEIDVEVRHRHAIRVEEALEEQAVLDRVDVRDAQHVGHERAGA